MAIRDQVYTRYDGTIREQYAWAVIGWTGFRTYWAFWRTKLTLLAVWLPPLFFALLVVAEYALQSQMGQLGDGEATPGVTMITLFLQVQIFSLALVYAANGCGIISDDLRHRTIQLYFSKPITRLDYGAGKYLTLLLLGTVAVIIPAGLLAMLRSAFYAQSDMLSDIIFMHIKGLLLAVILVAVMSAMVIGLSSLTRRTGYAVLAWIGVLLVPLILHAIFGVASEGSPLAALWSLPGTTGLASQALVGGGENLVESVPAWSPFAVYAGLLGAGLGSLYWRISRLEGIA